MTPPYPLWHDAQGQAVRGVTLVVATFQARMVTEDTVTPNTGWPEDARRSVGIGANVRRGNHIGGLVFLSWRMDDLFHTVFGEEPREVALEIFDGPEPVAERLRSTTARKAALASKEPTSRAGRSGTRGMDGS
jgi:hypothetical protein